MNASAPSFVPASSKNENNTEKKSETKPTKPTKSSKSNAKRPSNLHNNKKRSENKNYQKVLNDFDDLALTGKKGRISLNHLLNFSFPERQESQQSPLRKNKATSYQPFNKERFINANFRFMLNPIGNYIAQLADPDINFDWETIEQVLISSHETQSCPICLCTPTAARVAKCGHIYCLPCILHYLALRENPKKLWRKCPICYESIYESDLKPVRMMRPFAAMTESNGITVGDRVNLQLIQRSSQSMLAFPLSDTWPLPANVICNYIKPDAAIIPWHFSPDAMNFARFMLATPEYLQGENNRDCIELEDLKVESISWGSVEEIPYIESSIEKIQGKQKQLGLQKTKELEFLIQTYEMMYEAINKYNKKHGKSSTKLVETANMPANDFYFYQAVDGQPIYLHPLDIRILKHEFGEYYEFPNQIQVQATHVQESTLTEELRKKCKYLGHLPLACDVTFLEIDVKEIVSPETLQVYNQELTTREKKRKEKEKREDKQRQEAEIKQRRQMMKEQEQTREMLENDPFFSMYRTTTAEEEQEQLTQALEESLEDYHGPRTVWGTKQVTPREEEETAADWADHIIITKSHRKRKGRK